MFTPAGPTRSIGTFTAPTVFVFFISALCGFGLVKAAYEIVLALGPPWKFSRRAEDREKYFDGAPELRLRGAVRLLICGATLVVMVLAGLRLGAMFGHPLGPDPEKIARVEIHDRDGRVATLTRPAPTRAAACAARLAAPAKP